MADFTDVSFVTHAARGPLDVTPQWNDQLVANFQDQYAFNTSTSASLVGPAVANVAPADMSTLGSSDPITFEVTFTNLERRTIVMVQYPELNVPAELVHDGTDFDPGYGDSTRVAITSGWRYTIRRSGGWVSRPSPYIFAFDRGGLEL